MTYNTLPSLHQWQSDSSVTLAVRKDDIILRRVDDLLDHYHRTLDESRRLVFLTDVYMTADYWLKTYQTNKLMEKGRLGAMQALHAAAANDLCKAFKCTINGLPRELELMWGRELSGAGVMVDQICKAADYISRAQAKTYRLMFRGGKAYQLPWFDDTAPPGPVLAESKHAFDEKAFVKAAKKPGAIPNKDYGFFVLTMGRDLYMAKHRAVERNPDTNDITELGFYHSSYVAGDPIICSGTLLIEAGVIKRIRFDSGHYQPQANNYRALLMALRMWNVPLKEVAFEDFNGYLLGTDLKKTVQDPRVGTVDYVLSLTDDMQKLIDSRNKTLEANQKTFGDRPLPNPDPNVKSPDPRSWWGNRGREPEVQPPGAKKL